MAQLAINGGPSVREEVIPFVPEVADIGKEEKEETLEVLESKKLSQLSSEKVKEFEDSFSDYYGVKHAIATNSGTSALHVALAAAGLGPGQEVLLPPYTFMATANAVLHQNLVPNFVDVDPQTYNIDPADAEERLTGSTEAIIPVHMQGQPADMDSILDLAERHDLIVIEDACQANGAEYKGEKVGTFGDFGCFSFYLNKNITSGGEGGMVITDDDEFAKKARSIRNHCRVEESPYPNVPAHNVYWGIGYNYRMTAIQAAIGEVQLRKLDDFNRKRRENADFLTDNLKEIQGIKTPHVSEEVKHVYWVYGIRVKKKELGLSRDKFADALLEEGIKAEGYCPIPVHLQEAIRDKVGYGERAYPFDCPFYEETREYGEGLCPEAEKLSSEDLLLPVYQTLSEQELEDIVRAVKKVAENAEEV